MKVETVFLLNKIYCWVRAAGWLLFGLMFFWARGSTDLVYEQSRSLFDSVGIGKDSLTGLYTFLGFCAVILCFLNLTLAFVPNKKKWWYAHLFNHVIGILECCCIPLAVPLLVMWFRSDIKDQFID